MSLIPESTPNTSVHSAFGIPEIQYHIFKCFEQNPDIEAFRSLSRLARTSTLFKETALNILWRNLMTIVPLIKVMPGDLWTVVSSHEDTDVDDEIHTIQFTRSLTSSDWDRFDYYAPRIISLGSARAFLLRYAQDGHTRIHESVFETFCVHRRSHPLLKSLHALRINLNTTYMARFVTLLLSPSIVSLSITIDDEVLLIEELPGLLSLISCHCPNIREFTADFNEEVSSPQLISALESLASSLSHVRKLFVHIPFSSDAIYDIGNLPDIRDWLVHISSEVSTQGARDVFMSTNDRFSELRTFHLKAPHLRHATQAMTSLQRPLIDLHVDIKENDIVNSLPTLEAFARVFPHHPCASSLTNLWLNVNIVGFEGSDVTSAFRPFLDVHSMSSFNIVSQCVLELGDGFFADAANAWPRLSSLALIHPSPFEASGRPKATLSGLIPLIRHCPDLKNLMVGIIASPFEPELLLPNTFNMKITYLHFMCSYIQKPIAVFRCLVSMFPKLRRLTLYGGDEEWSIVSSLIHESSMDIWPELNFFP